MTKAGKKQQHQGLMSCRDVLWYMVLYGCGVNYMMKINLNLVIVAMVMPKKTIASVAHQCAGIVENSTILKNTTQASALSLPPGAAAAAAAAGRINETMLLLLSSTPTIMPEELEQEQRYTDAAIDDDRFDWTEYEQGLIIGAFYWLHWASQVPGGILGRRYGTKRVFGAGNFLASIITLILPLAMKYHFIGLIILRCLQGFIMGMMFPSIHGLPAKWVPPTERSKFVTAYLGGSLGTAITYPLCGAIIYYLNWEAAFYVTSFIGFLWCLMWSFLVYDSPHKHPRISMEELEYIVKNTSPAPTSEEKREPIPWAKILSSMPLWNTIIAHWGASWGFYTLLAQAPAYFNYIHGWSINMTGILSGAPHLVLIGFAYFLAVYSDRLLRENKMSRTGVRKMAIMILTGGQALMVIGLSFSGCRPNIAVLFMVLGTAMNGAMSTGTLANLVDLSPNYAAILLGINGLVVNAAGFLSPMIVGLLTNNNQTIEQWRLVFLIAAGNLGVACIIYAIWGTSKEQPWNNMRPNGDTERGQELEKLKPAAVAAAAAAAPSATPMSDNETIESNGKAVGTKYNEKRDSKNDVTYEWKDAINPK